MDYVAIGSRYLRSYLDSKQVRRALIVLVIVGVGFGGFYTNQYFKDNRQQKAILAFNEASAVYLKAFSKELEPTNTGANPDWEEVHLAFKLAYQANEKAEFAPFFLVYQAQALAASQKYQEAADLVGQALGKMSVNSPFYDLYVIMQAAMLIDAESSTGLTQLKNVAENSSSDYSAMAQFYLAQYYLSKNQDELAQQIFKQLAKQENDWAKLAQAYI